MKIRERRTISLGNMVKLIFSAYKVKKTYENLLIKVLFLPLFVRYINLLISMSYIMFIIFRGTTNSSKFSLLAKNMLIKILLLIMFSLNLTLFLYYNIQHFHQFIYLVVTHIANTCLVDISP